MTIKRDQQFQPLEQALKLISRCRRNPLALARGECQGWTVMAVALSFSVIDLL